MKSGQTSPDATDSGRRAMPFARCVAALLCCALGACAMAPGMRMSTPATLPVSAATGQAPAEDVQIPITDINLSLIKQLKQGEHDASTAQLDALFAHSKAPAASYAIGVGDVLQITVWDHPELAAAQGPMPPSNSRQGDPASGFIVDEEGNIQFPYVGALHVAGMTASEAQSALHAALSRSFKHPQLTLRIASFRSKQVYVDGEVRSPGAVQVNDIPMTLYEAISRAGGFSASADQSSLVLVRNGTSYRLDMPAMLGRGKNPGRLVLKAGDLLRVTARDENGVYVMGEVNKPTTALPLRDGRMSLSEAISQAGSLSASSADAAQLYVVRTSSGTPEVFHLDARSPVAMVLANEFEMRPKDIVYVDGNGLVRFSRVLSLLMPAINAGLTAAIVTK